MGIFGGGSPELQIPVSMDADDAIDEAKDLKESIDDVGEAAENTSKGGGKLGGVFDALGKGAMVLGGAVLGVGAGLIAATKAAADEKTGMIRLNKTIANSVKGWDGNTDAIEDYISSQTKLAFKDDELRDSLGFLVGQTQDLTEAQNLQALAMDLARSKGISLEAATKAVGKVDQDSINILKKLGIQVTDQMTKEEALTAIREATAGQAEEYAKSAAGSMERVQNSLGDAFETIGGAILPLVEGPLQDLADWLSSKEVQDGIANVAKGIGEFLAGAFNTLMDVIKAISPFVKAVWDYITSPTVVNNVKDLASKIGDFLGGAFTAIGKTLSDLQPTMKAIWDFLTSEDFLTTVGNIANAIGTVLGGAFGILKGVLDTVGPPIMDFFKGLLDIKPPTFSVDDLTSAVNSLGLAISTGTDPMTAFKNVLDDLKVPTDDAASALMAYKYAIEGGMDPTEAAAGLLDRLRIKLDAAGAAAEANKPLFEKLGDYLRIGWQEATSDFMNSLDIAMNQLWIWLGRGAEIIGDKIKNEWLPNFWQWISDIIAKLPGELAIVANQLWIWLQNGAKIMGDKVVNEWIPAFWTWITGIANEIGNKLLLVWMQVTKWLDDSAKAIGPLVGSWVEGFWMWITGPDGVLAGLGAKLNLIWTLITDWVDGVVKNIGNTVKGIGSGIVGGIQSGINSAWRGFLIWLNGKIAELPQVIKDFLGIKSPSKVMAAQVGKPIAEGIGAGFASAWPTIANGIASQVLGLTGIGGGGYSGGDPVSLPGGSIADVVGGMASNGSVAMPTIGRGDSNINIYLDGVLHTPAQLSQVLGARVRVTEALT